MENFQILKTCPWISDVIDIKTYFESYSNLLDDSYGISDYTAEFNKEEVLRAYFHMPDDMSMPNSRRTTPSNLKRISTLDSKRDKDLKSPEELQINASAGDSLPMSPINEGLHDDPFSVEELEKCCDVELLTVEGELPPRDLCQAAPETNTGRITNWYAGAFEDGLIPDGGAKMLSTLAEQERELYKRETIKDYSRLRHRLLKYHSTVRMIMKDQVHPEDVPLEGNTQSCLKDVIFNIRIQRPYYKTTNNSKVLSKFPKHSQELLMLGSQNLSELKDTIVCINDHYIHFDMSEKPDTTAMHNAISLKSLFPSSYFYINGFVYYDIRSPCRDITSKLRSWADKTNNMGKIEEKAMNETKLVDLKIRLGYPYLYKHLGNCEHLITFTDVRLVHRNDIQDPLRYPLSRGNPLRVSIPCVSCTAHKASWLVKDHPRIPYPFAHLCEDCLKLFCYDKSGKKLDNFKLFTFVDENCALKKLNEQKKMGNEQEKPLSKFTVELKGNLY